MATDAELLLRYVDQSDERAFEEVVRRHLGIVYSAALRRTGGRAHLAEEVSQKVFSSLARNAAWLVRHPTLIGWLYRCTRNAAIEALRSEYRRQKLAQSFSNMPDESAPTPVDVDWERLRPALDQAIDRLKEHDREIILLRFFQGLSFAEVGERLSIQENTARMRATRALDKLRAHLARQGVTSSAAALSLALAHPALASAPAGMATAVSATAVAAVPAGAAAGIVSFFVMSKVTAPLISAAVAAGLVTTAWFSTARGMNSAELDRLREENVRLTQVAKADDLSDRVARVARAITSHHAKTAAASQAGGSGSDDGSTGQAARGARSTTASSPPKSPRGHQWWGQATPFDAGRSFAWASDVTDVAAIAKLIWFEPELRERARAILATMPASIQAEYPTPEAFYAFVLAADALLHPPPVPETFSNFREVELREGRVAFRREGSDRNYHEYQQTPEGWKFVMPAIGVERWPNNLNDELLVKLANR